MRNVILSAIKFPSSQDAADYSAALYDAGYRKFEIVDAKEEATHCFGLPISDIQKMADKL